MFKNTVTLFNFHESENKYYPTLLIAVEFQPNYRTEFTSDSTRDKDLSRLFVMYQKDSFGKFALTEKGSPKYFLSPKSWNEIENKSEYFTLQNGHDFFVKGDFLIQMNIIYEEFKNSHDDVFLIYGVKDFENDLRHWEFEGY